MTTPTETEEFEFRARAEAEAAAAAPPPPNESKNVSNGQGGYYSPGVKDLVGAAVEPMMSMASGAVAQPVAGLAGIGAGIGNALGITNTPAADVVEKVQGGMTYNPRTQGGKDAMSVLGIPGELLHKAGGAAGEGLGDAFGPLAGTIAQTAIEGGGNILGGKLGKEAAKTPGLPAKAITPEVRHLADNDVTMTPGQIKGGITNDLEQKLTGIPVLGTVIKHARSESVADFANATINDGLKEIGQRLPKGMRGREAIDHGMTEFDNQFSTILPKLQGNLNVKSLNPKASSLRTDLSNVKSIAQRSLPAEQAATVARVIDQEVLRHFDPKGMATGKGLQEARENLRNEIEAHQISTTPADRKVAAALIVVRESMDKMIKLANPKYAKQYEKLRRGYAIFEIARVASSRVGAEKQGGVHSPAQYTSAVRSQDKSKGKRKFSRGTALGQPLARAGSTVLGGDLVPDSGTPGRLAVLEMLGGGGIGAAMGHPGVLAAAAVIPALYSRVGLKILQPFLLGDKSMAPGAGAALGVGSTQDERFRGPFDVSQTDELGIAP